MVFLRSRQKFFFGIWNNRAHLLLQYRHSNIYIVIIDCSRIRRHVFTLTAGVFLTETGVKKPNKRMRCLYHNLADMIEFMDVIFEAYGLVKFVVRFRSGFVRRNSYIMRKELMKQKRKVVEAYRRLPIAHNGVRGQHIRYKKTHRRRRKKNKR